MDNLIVGMKAWADTQERLMPLLKAKKYEPVDFLKDRCIVFTEPRRHVAAEFVLRNLRNAFPNWTIIIVHGNLNLEFMKCITSDISGIEFVSCERDDLPRQKYNELFTDPTFWGKIPYEWALITQSDTLIMDLKAPQFLQDLIDKDVKYIGAPWSYQCMVCQNALTECSNHMIDQKVLVSIPQMVGNGGLSFRHVPSLIEACTKYCLDNSSPKSQKGTSNEDVFFAKTFHEMGLKIADRLTALQFSIEQIGPLEWKDGPLAIGAHKPWAYLSGKLVDAILKRTQI